MKTKILTIVIACAMTGWLMAQTDPNTGTLMPTPTPPALQPTPVAGTEMKLAQNRRIESGVRPI